MSMILWLGLASQAMQPASVPPPASAEDEAPVPTDAADADADVAKDTDEGSDSSSTAPSGDDDVTADASGTPSAPASKTERQPKPTPSDAALARQSTVPFEEPTKPRRGRRASQGSPQRFAAEFKLGPYLPDVDRRYTGPGFGPYATIFGKTDGSGAAIDQPSPGVMPAIAFDWQFLYLAGPLGVGTQISFFRDSAQALLVNPGDDGELRSDADSVRFGMVPISLLLTYRFELLADRFRFVPLVPYAKAGVTYAFWWTLDGNDNISRNSQGEKGRGGVPGWQINLGGMLRLDFIEPGTAKKLDRLSGINHTYVFGEYQLSRIDNFGVGQAISLGDSTWFAGLAIEF